VLDRELAALPAKYRLPVFLCDLEGKKHREAARQLGWPEGTLETRLTAGRRLLAKRLTRQGVTLCAGGVAAMLAQTAATAAVPPGLTAATLKAGMLFAGGPATVGAISAPIITLAQGVLNAMLLSKIKIAAGLCLILAMLCAVPNFLPFTAAQPTFPEKAPFLEGKPLDGKKEQGRPHRFETREWQVRTIDRAKQTITVQDLGGVTNWGMGLRFVETTPGNFGPTGLILKNLKLAKDATITLDGKPAKLADLKPETRLVFRFAPKSFRLAHIGATKPQTVPAYVLKEIAPARNTISVADWTGEILDALPLAKNVDIEIHSKNGMRKAAIGDLAPGMTVHLELAPDDADKLTVRAIKASK
jgi:sigma-70-like protein